MMFHLRYRIIAVLLFAVGTIFGPAGLAAAEGTSKVMLVLEASGSMWGQVDGKAKIEIARSVIQDLLKGWDNSIELGLSAYGHRTKGDCADIQTLQPVGPVDAGAMMTAVNGLKPKGKTPLSDAVRLAAEEMKYTEERATVILVSDGIETCEADPCAVGKALEDAGVDFTVHVVGFDLKEKEMAGLQCLAENTGGQFLPARNAGGLHDALETTVIRVKEEAVKVVEAKPAPKPKAAGKPGHRFVATLAEGGPELADGMRWDIYEAAADADGKRKHIAGSYDVHASFKLNAGRYLVVAKRGNATASREFDAASVDDSVRHTIVLNAGITVFQAALIEGQDPLDKGMRWDVYSAEKDLDGKREHITGTYDAKPQFTLNTGKYYVVAKSGQAIADGEIVVEAGGRSDHVHILNAGLAVFDATYDEAGQPVKDGMRWDVYSADKDLDGKRAHIAGTYDTQGRFTLPAAKYLVVAKRGNAILSRELEIAAGKRNEELFVMNAGLVKLSAVLTNGKDVLGKGMRWDVYSIDKDLEGKRKHYAGTYDAAPIFTFNEGKYLVVAKSGSAVREEEIEIKAGKRAEPVLDLNAGIVKLIAKASTGNEVSSGVRWDVYSAEKDLEGKRQTIVGSYDAAPIFTLGSGKYLVVVKVGEATSDYELDVQPGDSKQVDVSMQ
jgi:Ca-activated chloride channel family protein